MGGDGGEPRNLHGTVMKQDGEPGGVHEVVRGRKAGTQEFDTGTNDKQLAVMKSCAASHLTCLLAACERRRAASCLERGRDERAVSLPPGCMRDRTETPFWETKQTGSRKKGMKAYYSHHIKMIAQ